MKTVYLRGLAELNDRFRIFPSLISLQNFFCLQLLTFKNLRQYSPCYYHNTNKINNLKKYKNVLYAVVFLAGYCGTGYAQEGQMREHGHALMPVSIGSIRLVEMENKIENPVQTLLQPVLCFSVKQATHHAVKNGDWNDASIWAEKSVPDQEAVVSIRYQVSISDKAKPASAKAVFVYESGALLMKSGTHLKAEKIVLKDKALFQVEDCDQLNRSYVVKDLAHVKIGRLWTGRTYAYVEKGDGAR